MLEHLPFCLHSEECNCFWALDPEIDTRICVVSRSGYMTLLCHQWILMVLCNTWVTYGCPRQIVFAGHGIRHKFNFQLINVFFLLNDLCRFKPVMGSFFHWVRSPSNQNTFSFHNCWACFLVGISYVWFCDSSEQSCSGEGDTVETGEWGATSKFVIEYVILSCITLCESLSKAFSCLYVGPLEERMWKIMRCGCSMCCRWWQPWVWWTLLIGLHGYCGRLCWCLCRLSYLFALAFSSNLISSFTTILEFFSSFSSCFHSTWWIPNPNHTIRL